MRLNAFIGPSLVYWPIQSSRKNIGRPIVINMRIKGIKKAPITINYTIIDSLIILNLKIIVFSQYIYFYHYNVHRS